jgi:hypothetical protein
MNALPIYVPSIPTPISLRDAPQWVQMCRYARIKSVAEVPKQATPISRDEVLKVCEGAPPAVAQLLALAWITTGRPGCVSQLRHEDITRTDEGLAVTFRRGKTAKLRMKPYTVTTIPGAFNQFLNLEPGQPRRFLFPCDSPEDRKKLLKDLVGALRLVNPTFESRSIRRGALQHMARAGAPATVLMSFSGHGTVAMLKTYLGFGTLLEDEAKQQRAAAQRALAEGAIRSEVSC